MAQSGYTPILIYASSTPGALPSAANLTSSASGAELAINYADGKLYFKNSSGVVTLLAGSSSGPAGGSNTQVQYNSSGVLAGSANFVWDNSNVRLGIGTSSPATKLDVRGTPGADYGIANIFDTTSAASGVGGVLALSGYKTTTSGAAIFAKIKGIKENATAGNEAGALTFETNSGSAYTERMRIDSSGNVGVGTTNPLARLVVSNSSNENFEFSTGNVSFNGGIIEYINRTAPFTTRPDINYLIGNSSGVHKFYTSNTERMRIDSSGNVGIGVTPSYRFDVSGASASGIARFANAWGDGTNPAILVDGTGSDGRLVQIKSGGTRSWPLLWVTASTTDVLVVNGDSTIKTAGTISVGGATPSTSGAGITFPATQSASSDANTLDDYEEGTWTPTAVGATTAGTTTYTTQTGVYTKIGRQVTVTARLSYSAMTGTGVLNLGGLPFTVANLGLSHVGSVATNNLNWVGGTSIAVFAVANQTYCEFFGSADDGAWNQQTCVNESADINYTVTYFTT